MTNPSWDPSLYLTYAAERTRPVHDLVARVPVSPRRVVDMGCGPGNSTAVIAERWPKASVEGVDSAQSMLEKARASAIRARWSLGDFDDWEPEGQAPDLIVSNAALHWADDPPGVARRLFSLLPEGGVLAVQVPQNFDQPSHTAISEVVENGPWTEALAGARRYDPGYAKAADYARALGGAAAHLDIWTTDYLHILEGEDPVFRWMSGTGLRPFLDRLEGDLRAAFVARLKTALIEAYRPEPDGRTFFPFKRLFVVATRA